MKTYKVVREFYDSKDDNRLYNVGDTYPADGTSASNERIKELSSIENAARVPLIEEVKARKSAFSDERNEDNDDRE